MSNRFNPSQLSFFITPPHQCPYIDDEESKTIFLSPEIHADQLLYTALINQGFRRSGEHIYRPNCEACQACISVRVPVTDYTLKKRDRRCLKKAQSLRSEITPATFNQAHYLLFDRYISERHRDGDMFPTSVRQYKEFLLNDWLETNYMNFYDIKTKKLVACSVFDVVQDGLSAVYTFFDPDYAFLSPGRLAILNLIELARLQQLPYVYLGYWIKQSAKMAYKGEYRPLECFIKNRWVRLS